MVVMCISILTGCSHDLKPREVVKTDFDLLEAEIILQRTWKPVDEMTNSDLETKPYIMKGYILKKHILKIADTKMSTIIHLS